MSDSNVESSCRVTRRGGACSENLSLRKIRPHSENLCFKRTFQTPLRHYRPHKPNCGQNYIRLLYYFVLYIYLFPLPIVIKKYLLRRASVNRQHAQLPRSRVSSKATASNPSSLCWGTTVKRSTRVSPDDCGVLEGESPANKHR